MISLLLHVSCTGVNMRASSMLCRLPRIDYTSGAGGVAVEATIYKMDVPSLAYIPMYSSALPPTGMMPKAWLRSSWKRFAVDSMHQLTRITDHIASEA